MHTKIGTDIVKIIGTSAVQLVGSNPRRVGLVISIPSGNRLTLSYRSDVTIDQGMTIKNQMNPFKLGYD